MMFGKWISVPLSEYAARRVCLIKPSALGDVVQSLPILVALRRRFPEAHLAWVVNRAYAGLLRGHPALDEVIEFERGGFRGGRTTETQRHRDGTEREEGTRGHRDAARMVAVACGFLAFLRELRRREFDLVVDLQGLARSGVMTLATGARRRVGLESAREGARWAYTDVVGVPTMEMSAVDRYWLVAEALGVGGMEKDSTVPIGEEERRWARAELAGIARPVVVVSPGARWETKRWPAEKFAEVARRAVEEFGAGVVIVGGPGEEAVGEEVEGRLCRAGAHEAERGLGLGCVNLVGRTTLKQLAAVLEAGDLVVTNDSGPMHLAAAVGTAVVAVFTCTSPVRAGPYGSGHTVVATGVWCAASYLKTCGRMECMGELGAERVWEAVRGKLRFIGGRNQGSGASD